MKCLVKPIRTAAFCLALVAWGTCCPAFTLLFQEDFDGIPLGPPVDEISGIQNAFSHDPPPGWFRQASNVPGVGDPLVGVFEWEGWSFANRDFWIDSAANGTGGFDRRSEFTLSQGTIAVADPDQWNDLGDPANEIGFYNTFLSTPQIDLTTVVEDQMKLVFDSSWLGGCCDDGEQFDPNGNNQTAILRANIQGVGQVELLRWESAPFRDSIGRPSTNPIDMPNPFFKPDDTNERVYIDLTTLLASSSAGSLIGASSAAASGVSFDFVMEEAGDDGFWGVDNVAMYAYTTLLGDMDISGVLDAPDIDAFALGMLDEDEYSFSYFGEFPVSRGSLDSTFDFDDIPWFVGVMEGAGLASASQALAHALSNSVPEPAALSLLALSLALLPGTRRTSEG